jgi:hypothetical protein
MDSAVQVPSDMADLLQLLNSYAWFRKPNLKKFLMPVERVFTLSLRDRYKYLPACRFVQNYTLKAAFGKGWPILFYRPYCYVDKQGHERQKVRSWANGYIAALAVARGQGSSNRQMCEQNSTT